MKYIATDEPIKDGYPNITHDSWSPSKWWREVNPNVIHAVEPEITVTTRGRVEKPCTVIFPRTITFGYQE